MNDGKYMLVRRTIMARLIALSVVGHSLNKHFYSRTFANLYSYSHYKKMSFIVEKLEAIKARFDELGVALTNPEIVSDNKRFSQISKEYRKLEKIVDVYKIYRTCIDSLDFAREVLDTESDEELRTMAKEDLEKLEVQKGTNWKYRRSRNLADT